MLNETPLRPQPQVLVVGSFPPVTGPAAAASLDAVRRAWDSGEEVVTASLRAGAADLVARVAGPTAGWHLERARQASGEMPRLVLGLGPEQLSGVQSTGTPQKLLTWLASGVSVLGLIRAFRRFDQVTVLLTGPLGLPAPLLKLLWRRVGTVVVPAGSESLAALQAVPTSVIAVVRPYPIASAVAGVTAVGPPEVLPRDIPVVALGIVGRRLLGERFLEVRFRALSVARRAKRQVAKVRG